MQVFFVSHVVAATVPFPVLHHIIHTVNIIRITNTCFLELVVCIGEKVPVPAELDYTNGIDMFIPTFINGYKSDHKNAGELTALLCVRCH